VSTPESKVKAKVKAILAKHKGIYTFMPATGGYGKSGVPDIVACLGGKFVGIECKAIGGTATALQMKNLTSIVEAGGYSFIVDDSGLGVFSLLLEQVANGATKPAMLDLTWKKPTSKEQDQQGKSKADNEAG
jgi:hypothetical protein